MFTAQVLLGGKFRSQFLYLCTGLLVEQWTKFLQRSGAAYVNLFNMRGKSVFKKYDRGQDGFRQVRGGKNAAMRIIESAHQAQLMPFDCRNGDVHGIDFQD